MKRRLRPDHNLIPLDGWREKVYRIIYLSNTNAGKTFDIILLAVILLSTFLVIIETVPTMSLRTIRLLYKIEFFITMLFTLEYLLRIFCVKNKKDYIFSFNGIIDALAIAPFYLSIIFPFTHYLLVIRLLRLLRVFRIFNLLDYMHDGRYIMNALKSSARKVYIFLLFVIIFIIIMGSIMYVIEGGEGSFNSIPNSIYWAAVTVTTVGYGDVTPSTPLGKFLSILVMLAGYSVLAVTTIIVTLDFENFRKNQIKIKKQTCERCGNVENDADARYCKRCGKRLPTGGSSDSKNGGIFSVFNIFKGDS
ncbi:ion transporter [Elizabethkingia sp. JS20170427COW]|uniref:ion transporter n=1 Tax=Elizabethkingia sp. JS20170427COW TaxID=2583851 RepID=UPI0011105AD9|nr:ion transporter [Elizabethkingia sp. JS20170427COW]QCX54145.1 ion transporter [Elizabethkingia sp. JS20170427COW]